MSTPVEITWLLAAVTKGDAGAFERLYAATCAKIYGVVLRILRRHDLAADVMEEAYLQIWQQRRRVRSGAVDADGLDGGDRAPPGHRPGAPPSPRAGDASRRSSTRTKAPARCRGAS